MDEHELSRRLAHAAGRVDVEPDLVEIERGVARRTSRRRWLNGVAAAMLVAGAGGAGFGLGHAAGDGGGDALSADGAAADAPATTEPADTEPADTEPSVATEAPAATLADPADGPPPSTPSPAPNASAAPATTLPAGDVGGAVVDVAADYAVGPEPMTLVATRELPDGTRVRTLVGQVWNDGVYGMEGGFQPASWCYPTREARVTIDGDAIVDVVHTSVYADLGESPMTVTAQRSEAGWFDGRPMRVLLVQSAGDATTVTVRWSDGLTDTADFTDGVAALVVDGGGAWDASYELDVASPAGVTTSAPVDVEMHNDNPQWREGCVPPPPSLPDAGEQPADPAEAEVALRDAFAMLWSREVAQEDKTHLLDDWTGVAEAIDEVDTGSFADAAASAVHTIDEVVFTSPTDAWFRYSIDTITADFNDRYGTATRIDGQWQFPRALMCQDLSLASGGCQPAAPPIFPPSWYEINGSAWYGSCDSEGNCINCQVFGDGSEECSSDMMPAIEAPVATTPAPVAAP